MSHRTTCGTTPRLIGSRGGKWAGLTPPPRIQDDLLSCVTITTSTHLTFVSAQFKHVLFLDLGAYILQEPRDTFGPYDFKNSKKAVYRALFLIRDYNTKSQKSKKLSGKSKFYKVPHEHDA